MNLWKETVKELAEHNKTYDDVIAIRGSVFQITKENFKEYANVEYDKGYGLSEVAIDLMVIGADFWLERHDYDGSEWWEFKQMPTYEDVPFKSITALTVGQAKRNGVRGIWGDDFLHQLNPHLTEKGE